MVLDHIVIIELIYSSKTIYQESHISLLLTAFVVSSGSLDPVGGRDRTQDDRWCPGRSVVKTVQGMRGEERLGDSLCRKAGGFSNKVTFLRPGKS